MIFLLRFNCVSCNKKIDCRLKLILISKWKIHLLILDYIQNLFFAYLLSCYEVSNDTVNQIITFCLSVFDGITVEYETKYNNKNSFKRRKETEKNTDSATGPLV